MEKLCELLENIENYLLSIESNSERELLCMRLEELVFDLALRVDNTCDEDACEYEYPRLQVL